MIEVLNRNLKKIDILRKYTFSQYVKEFRDIGTFKINAQLIDENLYLLNKEEQFYFLFDGNVFGVMESAVKTGDEEFGKVIEIQGRLAPVLFTKRIVYGTLVFKGNTSQYVRELVYRNIVEDKKSDRYMNINIQYENAVDLSKMCSKVNKRVTGGYLWDEMQPAMEQDNMGIFFNPIVTTEKEVDGVKTNISEWELIISIGTDRRRGNKKGNVPVVFSQSLSNIERTEYTNETKNYRNISYIAGEGESDSRKWYMMEINSDVKKGDKKGFGRSELWIDARDIQSEKEDGTTITEKEYETLIKQRANEKASENTMEESYTSTIIEENKQYVYGKDYNLGDLVTVQDDVLGIVVDAQITQVTKTVQGSSEIIDIAFTYGKINREPVEQIKRTEKRVEKTENEIKYLESRITKVNNEINKMGESSTTKEVKTNETWIDGKPIYRKVIELGSINSDGSKTFNHGISNVDNIWIDSSHSFLVEGENSYMFSRINVSKDLTDIPATSALTGAVNKTTFTLLTGSNAVFTNGYVTLLFTKKE